MTVPSPHTHRRSRARTQERAIRTSALTGVRNLADSARAPLARGSRCSVRSPTQRSPAQAWGVTSEEAESRRGICWPGWNSGRGVRVPHENRESEPIRWASPAPKPGADSDLERNLRRVCASGECLAPELARDALFWLDLGEEPRDVARWVRSQLRDGPNAARFPSMPADDSLFPQDEHTVEARGGTAWTRKRKRPTRRFFGRRAAS